MKKSNHVKYTNIPKWLKIIQHDICNSTPCERIPYEGGITQVKVDDKHHGAHMGLQ